MIWAHALQGARDVKSAPQEHGACCQTTLLSGGASFHVTGLSQLLLGANRLQVCMGVGQVCVRLYTYTHIPYLYKNIYTIFA